MSFQAIDAVLPVPISPAGRKLVALVLANAARKDGTGIFPGEERLVRETSLSAREVRRYIAELIKARVVVEVRAAHRGISREFRMDFGELEAAIADKRLKAVKRDRQSPRKGGHARPERRSSVTGKAVMGDPPTVLNRPQPSPKAKGAPEKGGADRVNLDRVGSPWPNLPEPLVDAELDPSILHLLDAAVAVAEEPLAETDARMLVGLVRANATGVVVEALSGIVAEHRDGNGGLIRSVPKLLRFAIKEAKR